MGRVTAEERQRAIDLRQMNAEIIRTWTADARLRELTHQRDTAFVAGRGSMKPKAVFVAERPGSTDARHRLPLAGTVGRLFNDLLGEIGWGRHEVYVTYLVKFYTPNGRVTTPAERGFGVPDMAREVRLMGRPPVVLLGRLVSGTMTGKPYDEALGAWCKAESLAMDAFTMEHPAYGVYQAENVQGIRERFAALKGSFDAA